MAPILNLLGFILVALMTVLATPHAQISTRQDPDAQFYYLRVNSTKQPWHLRWLVDMPNDHYLGLENFTIHPPSPPVKFIPTLLDNGNYILLTELVDDGNDSNVPQLAAMDPDDGSYNISLKVVCPSNSTSTPSADDPQPCPDGYTCTTDQWILDDVNEEGIYTNFRFAGFDGKWQAEKDASPHGWHVYWEEQIQPFDVIQLDLVPYAEGQT